jgi:pSer/pThr/pTyr-binding forkhead associated (FHA) protein
MIRFKWPQSIIMILILALFCMALPVSAQDDATEEPETPVVEPDPFLAISVFDIGIFPGVDLQVEARDADGQVVNLQNQFIGVRHDGELVAEDQVQYIGEVDVGTLTVFLLDLPPGVDDQTDAIQEAILTFAADPTMKEGIDYVAIYRVGEETSLQLLAPTAFQREVENLFRISPLETESGATALIDNTVALLGEVAAISPDAELRPSIVLITDGTDAVSENDPAAVFELATELGIPVHTIAVENSDLNEFSTNVGVDYLNEVAAESLGIGRNLAETETLADIWNNIAARRSNTIVRYFVPEPEAGTFDVELSLPDLPTFPVAATTVDIPGDIPTIVFLNPPPVDDEGESADSYAIGVNSIEDELRLRLQTEIGWLDGETRDITGAQLIINGEPGPDLDITQLDDFVVEFSTYVSGLNTIAVAIQDADGQLARTGDLRFTIAEGSNVVPDSLNPGRTWVYWLFVGILAFGLLLLVLYVLRLLWRKWRERRQNRPKYVDPNPRPKQRSEPTVVVEQQPAKPDPTPKSKRSTPPPAANKTSEAATGTAWLEILEAATNFTGKITISRPEFIVGSAITADAAFTSDTSVSRMHATIVQDGDVYRIFDEHSANGTYVNGQHVSNGALLENEDEIQLGAVRLRFHQA